MPEPNPSQSGLWRWSEQLEPLVQAEFRLSLGEGQTSTEANASLALKLGLEQLWIKQEAGNPQGSQKDRSLAYRLSLAQQQGERRLVISSSGNAALSFAAYARLAEIEHAVVLVSPKTPAAKLQQLQALQSTNLNVILSTRAMRLANYLSAKHGYVNLRPSHDPLSRVGYRTMAFEWAAVSPIPERIAVFASSGSTALGMLEGFEQLQAMGTIDRVPALDVAMLSQTASAADGKGLGVRHSPLLNPLRLSLARNGGGIHEVSWEAIHAAEAELSAAGYASSWEGAGAWCAMQQAARDHSPQGPVGLLLTGRKTETSETERPTWPRIESLSELDTWLEQHR